MSTTTVSKTRAFGQTILAICEELKLPVPTLSPTESGLPENTGWIFVGFGPKSVNSSRELGDTACLIISKSLTQVHSHLDLDGEEGYLPLPKKCGRVICHFAADIDLIANVIGRFVTASRRATVHASAKTVETTGKVSPMVLVKKPVVNALLAELSEDELDTLAPLPEYSEADFEEEAKMYAQAQG
jgi:hypothetical protein